MLVLPPRPAAPDRPPSSRGSARWSGRRWTLSLGRAAQTICRPLFLILVAAGVSCSPSDTPKPEPTKSSQESAAPGENPSFTQRLAPVISEEHPEFKVSVPVVNHTGRPVEFTSITTSCGCSSPALDAYT